MRVQEIIRRPLITEKSTELREDKNVIAFEVARDANKIQVKRAVEAQFKVKVAEVRIANVPRQGAPPGPVRRAAVRTGRRPTCGSPRARSRSSSSRGCSSDGDQAAGKPINRPRSRVPDAPDVRRDHPATRPRSRLTEGKTKTGGRNNRGQLTSGGAAAATSSATASSTSSATSTASRRRWRRSNTTRTARPASRCSTTRTARSATSSAPDGLQGGRRGDVGRDRRGQRRQRAAAAQDPARHGDPQHRAQDRQGRPDGPHRPAAARS